MTTETKHMPSEREIEAGCRTCGRKAIWHGSEHPMARPGTYLMEMGCHDGVRMDDDEYHEGWQPDVIYPPCPHSPRCCKACGGDGQSRDPKHDSDDCADCRGTGWKDGEPHWPASADDFADRSQSSPPDQSERVRELEAAAIKATADAFALDEENSKLKAALAEARKVINDLLAAPVACTTDDEVFDNAARRKRAADWLTRNPESPNAES